MNNNRKIINNIKNINLNLGRNNINISSNIINKINNKINEINNSNNVDIPKIRNTYVSEDKLFEPIGILDPLGLKNNPFTNEPYSDEYLSFSKRWSNFPMYGKREESIKAIYNNQVLLVISGTGSGKTVLTPKFALHTLNYQGRIAITNPKRAPTKSNAMYAALCMDVKLGTYVGMKYRDSDKNAISNESKLIYATDGWVLQKLQKDPMLSDLDMVIIDEAHERGIQIDLLLLLLKDLLVRRPSFKLIIMSATVNAKIFSDYFPIKEFKFTMIDAGEVPNYPIEEFYLDKPINKFDENGSLIGDSYVETAVDKVVELLRKHEIGDILVFFPGKGDTSDGCMLLHKKLERINKDLDKKIYCNMLTSTTDKETEELLTSPTKFKESGIYTRKVIFATEVAESSMTFDGLDYVIDTGLVNNNVFYSEKNMLALEKKYISKASHKQRRGRTGRTAPGTCYNLFTKNEFENKFIDYPVTPISSEDISIPLMYFLSKDNLISHIDFPIKYHDIVKANSIKNGKLHGIELTQFINKFIEKPPINTVKITIERLVALNIIEVKNNIGKITNLGKAVALFDKIPEIGRMLISGYNYHCRDDIINLAALFELTDYRMDNIFDRFRPSSKNESIKREEKKKYDKVKAKWTNSNGDHFSLLDIYNTFYSYSYDTVDRRTDRIIKEKRGDAKKWCTDNFLNFRTLKNIKDEARQINQKFGRVVQLFRETNPNNRLSHIFMEHPPLLSEKHNDNILRALLDGFYINIIKKTGNGKFINCFPEIKTMAGFTQDSLFSRVKVQYKYAFYSQLKSIFGKTSYAMISKISPALIENIKKSHSNEYIKSCWKTIDEKKTKNVKKTHSKQSKGKSSGKKFYRKK
jgi:pre-mRNA-splicing factor ATP-dependent RNA helicase DHX15/PRP43